MKKELTRIAVAFREAFETVGRNFDIGFFPGFPHGCCTWASIFIGNFLKEERCLLVRRVFSESNHEWTLAKGFIIDITSDQFDDSSESVIVAKESTWHNNLTIREIVEYSPPANYDLPHQKYKISDIYNSVKSKVINTLETVQP